MTLGPGKPPPYTPPPLRVGGTDVDPYDEQAEADAVTLWLLLVIVALVVAVVLVRTFR